MVNVRYIFWFVGFFFGLVIFTHSVQQTAKVVVCLGNIQKVGKRHREDGKTICSVRRSENL